VWYTYSIEASSLVKSSLMFIDLKLVNGPKILLAIASIMIIEDRPPGRCVIWSEIGGQPLVISSSRQGVLDKVLDARSKVAQAKIHCPEPVLAEATAKIASKKYKAEQLRLAGLHRGRVGGLP